MSDSITIQTAQSKSTEQYEVYDSPDGDEQQQMVGTYVANQAAEQVGEFGEFEVTADESDGALTLTQDKTTASFAVFSDSVDAIEATYISHEVLADLSDQDADSDSYEAPESLGITARPSSESAFNEALDEQTVSEEEQEQAADSLVQTADESDESDDEPSQEEQAEALVAGADGETESSSADSDSDSDEDVQIADDEIGL